MNKNAIKILSFIFLANIVMMGCSNSLESENNKLKKEITEAKDESLKLEQTVNELQSKLKEQEVKFIAEKKTAIQNQDSIYPIYTADINTYEKKIDEYIYINSSLPINQKLDALTKALSELHFNNLSIKVIKIEEVDKKKIAVVHLSESKENQAIANPVDYKGNSWFISYFQGSTGGRITSTLLVETLLQRDYKGQWIDGVRFIYNNGVCAFQHVPELQEINYRK